MHLNEPIFSKALLYITEDTHVHRLLYCVFMYTLWKDFDIISQTKQWTFLPHHALLAYSKLQRKLQAEDECKSKLKLLLLNLFHTWINYIFIDVCHIYQFQWSWLWVLWTWFQTIELEIVKNYLIYILKRRYSQFYFNQLQSVSDFALEVEL